MLCYVPSQDILNKDDTGSRENPHPLNKLNSLSYKEFHEESSNVSGHACMPSQNELAPYPAFMDIDATMFEAPPVHRDIRVDMENPQGAILEFISRIFKQEKFPSKVKDAQDYITDVIPDILDFSYSPRWSYMIYFARTV